MAALDYRNVARVAVNATARALVIGVAAMAAHCSGQAPAIDAQDGLPRFESVRIRPRSGLPPPTGVVEPNRFLRPGSPLRSIIQYAYGLPAFRIVGGPDWLETKRWDIDAYAARGSDVRKDMPLMVRALLKDHFGLVVTPETRDMALIDMTLSASAQHARGLRASSPGCVATTTNAPTTSEASLFCSGARFRTAGDDLTISLRAISMQSLAKELEYWLLCAVVDNTHVSGLHDVDLTFRALGREGVRAEPDEVEAAVMDQLGLQLTRRTAPVSVLAVQSAHPADLY